MPNRCGILNGLGTIGIRVVDAVAVDAVAGRDDGDGMDASDGSGAGAREIRSRP